MTGQEFSDILMAFFMKHDEKQLKNVSTMVNKFRGNEGIVMEHLCKKYNVDPSTIKEIDFTALHEKQEEAAQIASELDANDSADSAEGAKKETVEGDESTGTSEDSTEDETPKPKSKKKLILIVLIIVILGAAGGAAYMFKDKIPGMGSHEVESTDEAPADEAETQESIEPESEASEESVEPIDTNEVSTDSVETEEPKEVAEDTEESSEENTEQE